MSVRSEKTAVTTATPADQMAVAISFFMVAAGYLRVVAFHYSTRDALAISASLLAIVFTSVIIGTLLPMALHRAGVDPAHAGATIQVIMDLAGVCITCFVCSLMLPASEAVDALSDPGFRKVAPPRLE